MNLDVKVFVDNLELVASGTFITNENSIIKFKFTDEGPPLFVQVKFKDDDPKLKPEVTFKNIGIDTMEMLFINCGGPLGNYGVQPSQIGFTIDNRPIYINYAIYGITINKIKKLDYSIYLGEKVNLEHSIYLGEEGKNG